jgi:hypothetical protein
MPYHEQCVVHMGDSYNENLKKMKDCRKQIGEINMQISNLKAENEKLTNIARYVYHLEA